MIKRILSVMMCVMLIAATVVVATPAGAIGTDDKYSGMVSVLTDQNYAKAGDVVDFTVYFTGIKGLGRYQFYIALPKGLTYNTGSLKLDKDIASKLGYNSVDCVEVSASFGYDEYEYLPFIDFAGKGDADYNGEESVAVATFSVTVDDDAKGSLHPYIPLNDELPGCKAEFASVNDNADWTDDIRRLFTNVQITADEDATEAETEAPTEAETDAPTAAPTQASTAAPTTEAKAETTAAAAPTTAPTVKATTAATKDKATKTSSTAKTGDSTNMYLWVLIMAASAVGIGAVLYSAKRRGIFNR